MKTENNRKILIDSFQGALGAVFLLITILAITPAVARAGFAVPDTGQTKCFNFGIEIPCPAEDDAYYGQDAQFYGPQPNYTNNGNGTISDNNTGLLWQQTTDANGDGTIDALDKFTYTQARNYCANLNLAGRSDWRLPKIKELYSLIDFNGVDVSSEVLVNDGMTPFINTDYFEFGYGDVSAGERVIDAQYASSTLYAADPNKLFGVNFADGRIKGYDLTVHGSDKTFYVQCVCNDPGYGDNYFVDSGDGAVTDQASGLMWSRDDSGAIMDWESALAWVVQMNNKNYLGYNDWRLPDIKELQSILDYSRSPDTTGSAAIDPVFNSTSIVNEAGQTDFGHYWSSTSHLQTENMSSEACYMSFGRGMGYMDDNWIDVHGAGAQRSDPKEGNPAYYSTGRGPQGDAVRIYSFVRLVRDADGVSSSGSSGGGAGGGGCFVGAVLASN